MIAVVNASPLIYLGKLGVLDLLPTLFKEVWTTPQVKEEVLDREQAFEWPKLREAFSQWMQVGTSKDSTLTKQLASSLIHEGEASVIALANELKAKKEEPVLIIDDLAAREIARIMGFQVTGTIGVLLRFVKRELINVFQCKELLQKLVQNTDFRMTVKVYSSVLAVLDSWN